MGTSRATARGKASKNGKPLRVGSRVRFPYGVGEVDAEVIEDRGNLGVGGRQIVRVRILGRSGEDAADAVDDSTAVGGGTEANSFEMPAEELTLVR